MVKCRGKDCNNEVEKGWCLICQCEYIGYEAIGRFEEGRIVGLILKIKNGK